MQTPQIEVEQTVEVNQPDGLAAVQPYGPSQVHAPHIHEHDQAAAASLSIPTTQV